MGGEPHEIHHQPEAGCGRIRDDSRVTHLGSPSQNAGDGDDFAIQAPYHCELESPTGSRNGKEDNTLYASVNDKEPRPGHRSTEEMHPTIVATHSR